MSILPYNTRGQGSSTSDLDYWLSAFGSGAFPFIGAGLANWLIPGADGFQEAIPQWLAGIADHANINAANDRSLVRLDEAGDMLMGARPGGGDIRGFTDDNSAFSSLLNPEFSRGSDLIRAGLQTTPHSDIDFDSFSLDHSGLDASRDRIGSILNSAQSDLQSRVELPDFAGDEILGGYLSSIGSQSAARNQLQTDQMRSQGLARGGSLEDISSGLDAASFSEAQSAGRSASGARSQVQSMQNDFDLRRTGIEAGLATAQDQINAQLAQTQAGLEGELGTSADAADAVLVGQRLAGTLTENDLNARIDDNNNQDQIDLGVVAAGEETDESNASIAAAAGQDNFFNNAQIVDADLVKYWADLLAGFEETIPMWSDMTGNAWDTVRQDRYNDNLVNSGGGFF